jgi:hypothetical protein
MNYKEAGIPAATSVESADPDPNQRLEWACSYDG